MIFQFNFIASLGTVVYYLGWMFDTLKCKEIIKKIVTLLNNFKSLDTEDDTSVKW